MIRCARCDFQSDEDEAAAQHAQEAQHPRCIVCQRRSLTEHERQTCQRCANRVRDDVLAVAELYEDLERVIREAAYRGGNLTALAMSGDGSLESPQRPNQYTEPREVKPTVHVWHDALTGERFTLPAFLEERVPSDGREHVVDHWPSDPVSVLAQLEQHERMWRQEFGHGPAVDVATVAGCVEYLTTWHTLAARTFPGFAEYAEEIRGLRSRLEHVAGLANDPRQDPIPCACGGDLVQEYGPRGLEENRWCRDCGTVYEPDAYAVRRLLVTETPGWVSEVRAAELVGRPVVTIKAWAKALDLPSVCHRLTRRVLVDATAVQALHEERDTRRRAS